MQFRDFRGVGSKKLSTKLEKCFFFYSIFVFKLDKTFPNENKISNSRFFYNRDLMGVNRPDEIDFVQFRINKATFLHVHVFFSLVFWRGHVFMSNVATSPFSIEQ